MCRAACSPIQYIKRFKSDVLWYRYFFLLQTFVRRAPHAIWSTFAFAFGLYEIFVFYVCSEHSVVTHCIRSPFIAARKATITKETTKNNRAKKKTNIFIHLICLHDIRWPGIREFITRIEGETQNSIYRFPNKYFIYLHVFVIEHFHSCFSTIFPPTAVCSTHVRTRIVLPMVCAWGSATNKCTTTVQYMRVLTTTEMKRREWKKK